MLHRFSCKAGALRASRAASARNVLGSQMAWSRSFAVGGLEHKVPEPWLHDRPFRLEEITGRGLGAVATKDLLPGDVVLLERPILAIRSDEKGDEWNHDLHSQYKALSEEGRAEVWKLHDACLQKPEKSLEGILFTNCIGRDQSVRFDAALCLALSRFNHSCCPNLEQSWDEDAGHVRLVAAQPVKAGEELFTHYVELRECREERQQRLQESYGFLCSSTNTCPVCSGSAESDKRRTEMGRLDASIRKDRLSNLEQSERMVKRLLRLYDQEGLGLFSWRKLHCLSAMEFALRRGDVPMAVQWARKAHENARLAHGPDHRDTRWCAELMKDPSSHPSFEYRSQNVKNWAAYALALTLFLVVYTVSYD